MFSAAWTARLRRILVTVMLLGLAACAAEPKNLFVLLPEDDGTVGSIAVSNPQGVQVLVAAGQATGLDAAGAAPQQPFTLQQDRITRLFADVLGAQPEQPVKFLLYFRTGTTTLTDESERQIPSILAIIAQRRVKPQISVVGHTDRAGSAAVNARLALRRAEAEREILYSYGVGQNAVELSSHGENNPVVPTPDGVSEPRNRRVEVTVR
jgi:outer membrane protein OmpA-like peptidoglycan-associated protein